MRYFYYLLPLLPILAIVTFMREHLTVIDAPDVVPSFQCIDYEPLCRNLEGPFAFSPIVDNQKIKSDLIELKKYSNCLRTYSTYNSRANIPAVAEELGLKVILGAWLKAEYDSKDVTDNFKELNRLIELSKNNSVERLIVGNESLQFKRIKPESLVHYLKYVRSRTNKPVTTSETIKLWDENFQMLSSNVDYYGIEIHPYYELPYSRFSVLDIAGSVNNFEESLSYFKQLLISKNSSLPILITEIGWPSFGSQLSSVGRESVASLKNQAWFTRHFLKRAEQGDFNYIFFELKDCPVKIASIDTIVGGSWGFTDAFGKEKFSFQGSYVQPKENLNKLYSLITVYHVVVCFFLFISRASSFAAVIYATLTSVFFSYFYCQYFQFFLESYLYLFPSFKYFVLPAAVLTFILIVINIDSTIRQIDEKLRKLLNKADIANNQLTSKFVSIHIPCRNEDPEILSQTLNALSKLNYKQYEVVLVVNNTSNNARVEEYERLFTHFFPEGRFANFPHLVGYKAGALKAALALTSKKADFVAILDADYQVCPEWLNKALPHFDSPEVYVVQCPQAYMKGSSIADEARLVEYDSFHELVMPVRAVNNSVILQGTMCVLRHEKLIGVGGWNLDTIVEDTELGLRLLLSGGKITYLNEVLGRGLLPATQNAYLQQRERWSFGATCLIRDNLFKILFSKKLTAYQKYFYISGWSHWLAAPLSILFFFCAYGSLMFYFLYGAYVLPWPIITLYISYASLCAFSHFFLTYFFLTKSLRSSFLSLLAGASLTTAIACGVIKGILNVKLDFIVTQKKTEKEKRVNIFNFYDTLLFLTFLIGITLLVSESNFRPMGFAFLLLGLPGASSIFLRFFSRG